MALTAAPPAPSPAVTPPPGNPRFALFDSLRGIAVLAVLVFHVMLVAGTLDRPVAGDVVVAVGTLAPPLFFAISGFLLYRPWLAARAEGRPGPRVSRYARRRALRILPAYWLALTVLAVFPGITGVFTGDWWVYYGLVQIYSEDTLSRGIPVAWTLCVEATFYVALPLWTLALDRARLGSGPRAWIRAELAALTAVAVAGAAVQVAASRLEVSHLVGTSLLGQCIWMAIGMALAVASVAGERSRAARLVTARPGFCWLGAAAAVTGLTILHRDVHGIVGIIQALGTPQPFAKTLTGIALSTVAITLVMLPAVFGERAGGVPRRLLALRPLVWLGVVSYGLYLWHLTIAELLALPAAPQHFSASGLNLGTEIVVGATPVLIVLTLAASGVLAGLSYRWVELPFLRRKER